MTRYQQQHTPQPLQPHNISPEILQEMETVEITADGAQLNTLRKLRLYSMAAAYSGFAPKALHGKPDAVMVVLEAGIRFGLTPLQAMGGIAAVDGKALIFGDTLRAIIIQSPLFVDVEEEFEDDKQQGVTAICKLWRKGRERPFVARFSMAQASKAGLVNKDNWKKYPDRMLQKRAFSRCARDAFPDVLAGTIPADDYDRNERPPRQVLEKEIKIETTPFKGEETNDADFFEEGKE